MSSDKKPLAALTLGALGVVYGDIGTSPLYTMKEVFGSSTGIPLDAPHLMGAASVVFWSLMVVVTLKYIVLILRADNNGEGGIMALTALAAQTASRIPRRQRVLLILGLFGAALFYGDSVITPAISVLSAMEGMEVAAPSFKPWVLPVSCAILIALFLAQRHGTAAVGRLFGPVMVIWFLVIAAVGLVQVVRRPEVLQALNPLIALEFLRDRGWGIFPAMGTVVLALTGAEALYADMGHFGKKPIRIAWIGLVLPALTLNYFGQCAMLIAEPKAIQNPFFHLFPSSVQVLAVVLAGAATVIASQAVISGAYSMTKEAIQLGFLPRMRILHTSHMEIGQIYVPLVNWLLLTAVLIVTLGFESSDALASAYGIAVTTTMLITTLLTFFVVRHTFGIPLPIALGATIAFAVVDSVFVMSCAVKFVEGGWLPVAFGFLMFAVMATWQRGRQLLAESIRDEDPELLPFVGALLQEGAGLARVPRTAVFPVSSTRTVPQALLHNLKHNRVLHEQNVLAVVDFGQVPFIPPAEQLNVEQIAPGFFVLRVRYGFKNAANLPDALARSALLGLYVDPMATSYFLSRANVIATKGAGMAHWREMLFAGMMRNAGSVANFFQLPNNAVIELGTRVAI